MRILGIDIGNHSAKAVEVDSAFGRFEVQARHKLAIQAGQTHAEIISALLASFSKPADRVVMAFPTRQSTFRNLTLPTKDKKSINASVAFELEDELPFPVDESVHEHTILSQVGQSSFIHVGAAPLAPLKKCIEEWNSFGLDPDIVTSEVWALKGLINRYIPGTQQEKPIVILQLGHSRSLIYIHHHGNPIFCREITWGGREITTALSKRYNIPIEQAETAKLEHGFVLPPSQREQSTEEQKNFSDDLIQSISEVVLEVRQAIFMTKNLTKQPISHLYLTGGTALLPGLARVLEEELNIHAEYLKIDATLSDEINCEYSLATALALLTVGVDKSHWLNLRKEGLAKVHETQEFNFSKFKKPALAVASMLSCLMISTFIQSQIYQNRLADIDTQLEKSVKSFFGQLSNSAAKTYLSAPNQLKKSIQSELDKQRELNKLFGTNPRPAVAFLADLSQSIPKSTIVDLIQFQIGAAPGSPYTPEAEQSTSFTFLVSDAQVAEKVSAMIEKKLMGMQRSKVEEVTLPKNEGKRWKFTLSGKVSAEIYDK